MEAISSAKFSCFLLPKGPAPFWGPSISLKSPGGARRFQGFCLGLKRLDAAYAAGIEKKQENFAEEIASMVKG